MFTVAIIPTKARVSFNEAQLADKVKICVPLLLKHRLKGKLTSCLMQIMHKQNFTNPTEAALERRGEERGMRGGEGEERGMRGGEGEEERRGG